ncbi:hypothetical protein B0H19DRAFT_1084203 [Mycena capillaripes]|nr:hypothetical protein B0H19DRAFT_1084203 [Mycena capillaripes]
MQKDVEYTTDDHSASHIPMESLAFGRRKQDNAERAVEIVVTDKQDSSNRTTLYKITFLCLSEESQSLLSAPRHPGAVPINVVITDTESVSVVVARDDSGERSSRDAGDDPK